MIQVNTLQPSSLSSGSLFALGDDRVIEVTSGPFNQLKLSVWNSANTKLVDQVELVGPDEPSLAYLPWHVRDDGDGAFTVFVQGYRASTNERNLLLASYDADGTRTNLGTYEALTFDKFRGNAAIDVGEGRVLSVVNVGNRVETDLFDADGTIINETLWNATESGAGSARGSNLNFAMTRSGDTVFTFYINDDAHAANAGLFLTRLTLTGELLEPARPEEKLNVQPFSVGGTLDSTHMLDAITLTDGRVVLVTAIDKRFEDDGTPVDDDLGRDIFLRMFNPDGSVFLPETRINEYALGTQQEVRAYPLEGGGFVVLYHNIAPTVPWWDPNAVPAPFEGPEDTVIFRLFDADGQPVGDSVAPMNRYQYGESTIIFPDGTGYVADSTGVFQVQVEAPVAAPEIPGDDGPNLLVGGPEAERLTGAGGDDTLDGGAGDDTINGGPGNDTWLASGDGAVIVNLGTGLVQDGHGGSDALLLVENARGGAGNDVLVGDVLDNLLEGMGGDDTLDSGGGNNTIDGGEGNDTYVAWGERQANISLVSNDARYIAGGTDILISIENLRGTSAYDVLQGDGGDNLLEGMGGNDNLLGGPGDDTLDGGTGRDSFDGGTGNDIFYVDNRHDTLTERVGDGEDTVLATSEVTLGGAEIEQVRLLEGGNHRVNGNRFDTEIIGNSGNNILIGGGGDDTVTGGGGQDFFVFLTSDAAGTTRITDFGGRDQIALDDRFFGLGDATIDIRQVTQAQINNAVRSGAVEYDFRSGEIWLDGDGRGGPGAPQLIAVIEGGGTLGTQDVLLF